MSLFGPSTCLVVAKFCCEEDHFDVAAVVNDAPDKRNSDANVRTAHVYTNIYTSVTTLSLWIVILQTELPMLRVALKKEKSNPNFLVYFRLDRVGK
jgi:hypothetical protein